ncbi:MAG: hypothetical protein AVDCRST_MAG35-2149, partial [uncultured Quadrisphaera sp.]
ERIPDHRDQPHRGRGVGPLRGRGAAGGGPARRRAAGPGHRASRDRAHRRAGDRGGHALPRQASGARLLRRPRLRPAAGAAARLRPGQRPRHRGL